MSFFIGFMDGDGYFDISSQKQTNKGSGKPSRSTIRIRLACNLHDRDLPLLQWFQTVLGVGTID
jgi:hypothetical protein